MATRADTVEHLLERAGEGVTTRRMFGEYAVYRGEKVVALVCDDALFLKPTAAGREALPGAEEAPPYPGAKPHLVVDRDLWDEGGLPALLRATAEALPQPKPKKGKAKGA